MVRLFGRRKQEEERKEAEPTGDEPKLDRPQSPSLQITVPQVTADRARRELKLLEVERDVAQYALTRIYEAEASGQITEQERNGLADRYKSQMKTLEERIGREQMLVELRELELGQVELVRIFNEKFGDLDKRVQGIRVKLGHVAAAAEPKPEMAPVEQTETEASTSRRPRAARPVREEPSRTKAEIEIERIQEEVRKALEKLEQIELEG